MRPAGSTAVCSTMTARRPIATASPGVGDASHSPRRPRRCTGTSATPQSDWRGCRKGSAKLSWEGGGPLPPDAGAWPTVAPSDIPFDNRWPAPQALDEVGLTRIRDAHAAAVKRANRLGFDLVELLGAHGFLLHSFLSPITNQRTDSYGGSLANRMRYPLEVAAGIREVWPRDKALGMRITGTDWVDGGITPDEAGVFAGRLREIGFDYVCVPSGGISPAARPAIAPRYQVPLAAAVKKASGIVVQAVGMIVDPHQAGAIVADGHADCVARGFSTTRVGSGMPPPRSEPMPSTRRSICTPARNIGRARR